MPQLTLAQIAVIVGGKLHLNLPQSMQVSHLVLDSRKQAILPKSLFFAIKGVNHNGHHFIIEAQQKGIDNFVVSEAQNSANANFVLVDDVVEALQKLAHYNRKNYKGNVVGITGSNGKTIVKEWLGQLLQTQSEIYKSPRSYNSQVGVPLSLWGITPNAHYALIEVGISQAGEMEKLAQIVQPQIGIFTHWGTAHENGFDNPLHKLKEKLKLFENAELLIFNDRQQRVTININKILPNVPKFTWSQTNTKADLYVENLTISGESNTLTARYKNVEYQANIPFKDKASVENCITCWATLIALTGNANIGNKLMHLAPINMRLQSLAGANNCQLISDCYNADWDSLTVAFEELLRLPHQHKSIILTEFEGVKNFEKLQYRFHDLLGELPFKNLILIGNWNAELFTNATILTSTEAVIKAIPTLNFNNEAILIKGARQYRLEQLVDALSQQKHETKLTVKMDALLHNLNVFRAHLPADCQLMVMVKAFAYGAGNIEIARLLQHQKVDYLAVAYTDEGIELRRAGINLPIMIMNTAVENYADLIRYQLQPQVHSKRQWQQWAATPKASTIGVHIKLDTGMGRLGFQQSNLNELINLIDNQSINIVSCLTHLAASEDESQDAFTNNQLALFQQLVSNIEQKLGHKILRHAFNSAAINRFSITEKKGENMVRLGIGLYGIGQVFNNWQLQLVPNLQSYILQIKEIKAGQSVGYGRAWVAPKNTRIAVVGIGYADGLPRLTGNGNYHLKINEQAYPIIGNVCMDMCMIDIGNDEISETDTVIIFNTQSDLEKLAKAAQTIPYEIIARISQRVKRVYVKEG